MEARQFICDACRAVDFRLLLQTDLTYGTGNKTYRHEYLMRYSPNCVVCDMLIPEQDRSLDTSWAVYLRLYFDDRTGWALQYAPGGVDDFNCLFIQPEFALWSKHTVTVLSRFTGVSKGHFVPRILERKPDYALAKTWLQCCLQCHDLQCGRDASSIEGLELINCDDLTIVKADDSHRWLALSYVWGENSDPSKSEPNENRNSLPAQVPQTVKDAIIVTKRLGYQFLWVDEYCIDQNDKMHRAEQIRNMDSIYSGADLTIVAAAGYDKHYGLPGVSVTGRTSQKVVHLDDFTLYTTCPEPKEGEIQQSKWFERGWTFQEGVLSKRLLLFTEHQMVFFCEAASWLEAMPPHNLTFFRNFYGREAIRTKLPLRANLFDSLSCFPNLTASDPLARFFAYIELYSCRELKHVSDVLDAFAGVMNALRQKDPVVYNIKGLPYCTWYKVESGVKGANDLEFSVKQSLLTTLSWSADPAPLSSRRHLFPSWTWAEWAREVRFICDPFSESVFYEPTLRNVQFQASNGDIFNPPTTSSSAPSNEALQDLLDTVAVIHFQAPIIPAVRLQRNQYEENCEVECSVLGRGLDDHGNQCLFDDTDGVFDKLNSGVCSILLFGQAWNAKSISLLDRVDYTMDRYING